MDNKRPTIHEVLAEAKRLQMLEAKSDEISKLLEGLPYYDVLGIALSLTCAAAKCMHMSKLHVQRHLVMMWDIAETQGVNELRKEIEDCANK
jgi:hypothetical protein